MPRRWAFVLILMVVLLTAPAAAHAMGERSLGLSATKFDFSAAPGQTGKGSLWVTNEGETAMAVKVYTANLVVDKQGKVSYQTPATDADPVTNPASWVQIDLPPRAKSFGNIPYIELGPGERVPVKFTMTVPKRAVPGDRQAILFFEMFQPGEQLKSGTARVNARIGTRVRTRVKGTISERVEIRPFYLPRFVIGSSTGYTFRVLNEGNVDQRISGRMMVLDFADRERRSSVVVSDTPVYAGTAYEKSGKLAYGRGALGRYSVRLDIRYPSADDGVEKIVTEERSIWIVPLWLIVTLLALGGFLALYLTWRSGRKAAEKRLRRERQLRREDALRDYAEVRDEA